MKSKINFKENLLNDILYSLKKYVSAIVFKKIDNVFVPYKSEIILRIEIKSITDEEKRLINNLVDMINFKTMKYPEILIDYENNEISILKIDRSTLTILQTDETMQKLYTQLLEFFE